MTDELKRMGPKERLQRATVAALGICEDGRETASASLCGEAKSQIISLRAERDTANEAARQAHILVSERDARIDALASEVERLREAIRGATFMDSQSKTVHAAKQDWVDLAELWPVFAEVHSAALEGKDG